MDAGIKLHIDAIEQYNSMKIYKVGKPRTKFIRLKMNKKQDYLVVDNTLDCQQQSTKDGYQQLLELLPDKSCCFLICDISYNTKDSVTKNELILIMWCPSNAGARERMQYTATKKEFKAKLSGLKTTIEATSKDDLAIEELAEALGSDVTAVEGLPV